MILDNKLVRIVRTNH